MLIGDDFTPIAGIGRQLDDQAALGRAADDLPAARAEPPAVLALGEPTHGIAAFPLLRNDLLRHLVTRGYRSVVLETDFFAASVVDGYARGGEGAVEEVLATGFSHRFGAVPGNRELVEWLRGYNAGRPPRDQVRFHGFDAPTETSHAPSPRHALAAVRDHLPGPLRPGSAAGLDVVAGEDADWTNPAAMYDPSASVGRSDRARALRAIADDLADALRRAEPDLRPDDPTGYDLAAAHARTARGLLRYHAAMADPSPDRLAALLDLRAEMMADNLLAIVAAERDRGPSLVFAHNAHLLRTPSTLAMGGREVRWSNAGTRVARTLGERYLVVATDANPRSEPGTLQHVLAGATTAPRALFPAADLRAALAPSIRAGDPIVPGHLPLTPADLAGADAVVFVADTDGVRHEYW
ncbi:erythromycin esterase family protein [Actinosynnema sp. NPDC053489]|uniref:erythromycin esterase family protein n=1 Tax=Actinosynnema sp. NPDC053489 TaxID=3363916 RepID=UPI0037C600CD